MGRNVAVASLLLVCAASLGGCNAAPAVDSRPPLEGARIGGPFTLTDQNGRTVTDKDFAGQYRIVYFGYSFCPDICPVDLQKLMRGLSLFEKADPRLGANVQPLFITIDPARDTPQELKPFVERYHPRLLGLTGTPEQIAAVAKEYVVRSEEHTSELQSLMRNSYAV